MHYAADPAREERAHIMTEIHPWIRRIQPLASLGLGPALRHPRPPANTKEYRPSREVRPKYTLATERSCLVGTSITEPILGSDQTWPNQTEVRPRPPSISARDPAHTIPCRPLRFGQPRLPILSLGSAQTARFDLAPCFGPDGSALARLGQHASYTTP